MRYSLRTLLIVLAVAPPILAVAWFILGDLLAMAFATLAVVNTIIVFAQPWSDT